MRRQSRVVGKFVSKTHRLRTLKPEAAEPMGCIAARRVGVERQRPLDVSRAILALALVIFAVGCEKNQAGTQAGPPPEVLVIEVPQQDVELFSEWVGTTTGYVNAEIRPKVQGYLLQQLYRDGDVVKQGQVLFQLDPRQFEAALDIAIGELKTAEAILEKTEIDVARYTPLAAQGAVSQQELDNAIQARAAQKAQVFSAQANVQQARLNLDWTKVRSPVSGIAGIAKAQIGDLVGEGTELTAVSQLEPIKVSFPISEIEYLKVADRINAAEQAPLEDRPSDIDLILADGTTYPHKGRLSVAGLAVSATTGTIPIQAVFPNPDNILRPGQFAKVRAVTDRRKNALVIPQRAVRQLQGMDQVAVVGADGKVSFKTVTLGPASGSSFVVDSGLQAGDRIVVQGLQKIRDGMAVAAKPAPPDQV
jgi:membrane fusion protein (multidrug efflux system)